MKRYGRWFALIVVLTGMVLFAWHIFRPAPVASPANPKHTTRSNQTPVAAPVEQKPSFDKTKHSTTDAASLWVVVNKQHPLSPLTYAPASLLSVGNGQLMRTEAAQAFLQMQAAASAADAPIAATSAYRSYSYQQGVYGGYVRQYGVSQTDTFSARPGYSEHQTGLAVDIQGGGCALDNCFANTPQGKWLAENDYKYGFILRYTADKTEITGYTHEAWHFRYVGVELATEMHDTGTKTLEEFFGISGGSSY